MFHIVVAKYNEDVSWLTTTVPPDNLIIYDKSAAAPIARSIPLPNLGREAGTYLQYIITNYPNFPDVVIFTQGNIADHTGVNDSGILFAMGNSALENGVSKVRLMACNNKKECNFGEEWNKDYYNQKGKWYLEAENYYKHEYISFKEWFERHITTPYPNVLVYYPNALFAVRRDRILARPLEFYTHLHEISNHHQNTIESHFLERSWYYIFGGS